MQNRLPVGIENFKEMICGGYFYIDKTDFIEDTFEDKVSLYIRPRRFGKTLNLSMLRYFYSINEKNSSFICNGLKISRARHAIKFQNQYPVISITLKGLADPTFDLSLRRFSSLISALVRCFPELFSSSNLDEDTLENLRKLKKEPLIIFCSLIHSFFCLNVCTDIMAEK